MAMIRVGIMVVSLVFALFFFWIFLPGFFLRFCSGLGMIWRKEMGGVFLIGCVDIKIV